MFYKKSNLFLLITLLFLNTQISICQETIGNTTTDNKIFNNTLEFSPLSPLMNIYAIQYGYKFSKCDEGIVGPIYMSIPYDNVGRTHATGMILGYRRYITEDFNLEYQIMPMYDNFYEKNEDKYYNSIDIWNEFRVGYKIDFYIASLPCYINVQWPFGFALYASNKPQRFKDREQEGDNRFFYKALLIFVGVSF